MGRVEDHLTPQQLSYLSDRARARWCIKQDFLPQEPANHMPDERSWGAVDWFVRGADSNDIVVFGRRLPAPFGKPTYELLGRAIVGSRDDSARIAMGDRDKRWPFLSLLGTTVALFVSLPLMPILVSINETLALFPLAAALGIGGYFLAKPRLKQRSAAHRVATRNFALGDPIAEIIRLDAQNPDAGRLLGAVMTQAVAHPDLGPHYLRMAQLLVAIDTDADRYSTEVVASLRNATSSVIETPPHAARDCERVNESLEQILTGLKKLDRALGGKALWSGLNPGKQRADAAIADALNVIAREADGHH